MFHAWLALPNSAKMSYIHQEGSILINCFVFTSHIHESSIALLTIWLTSWFLCKITFVELCSHEDISLATQISNSMWRTFIFYHILACRCIQTLLFSLKCDMWHIIFTNHINESSIARLPTWLASQFLSNITFHFTKELYSNEDVPLVVGISNSPYKETLHLSHLSE